MATPLPRSTGSHVDEISLSIIAQLQQDGRRAYATIGKAVGLSEAAVRQRVQRLVESGVVHIAAIPDPAHLGLTRQAMIGIQADGNLDALTDALSALPETGFVVVTAGTFDVLVEIVCEDDEHLLSVLNTRIRTLPGVHRTETFVHLSVRKDRFGRATR